jgi:hypothetical protein
MHLYVSLLAETRAKLRRATHIDELIRDWNSAPPDVFIFQTGVGTRALFAATDLLGLTDYSVTATGLSAGGRTRPQAGHGAALAQGAHRRRRQRPFRSSASCNSIGC